MYLKVVLWPDENLPLHQGHGRGLAPGYHVENVFPNLDATTEIDQVQHIDELCLHACEHLVNVRHVHARLTEPEDETDVYHSLNPWLKRGREDKHDEQNNERPLYLLFPTALIAVTDLKRMLKTLSQHAQA